MRQKATSVAFFMGEFGVSKRYTAAFVWLSCHIAVAMAQNNSL
jgi:hypothetical protein